MANTPKSWRILSFADVFCQQAMSGSTVFGTSLRGVGPRLCHGWHGFWRYGLFCRWRFRFRFVVLHFRIYLPDCVLFLFLSDDVVDRDHGSEHGMVLVIVFVHSRSEEHTSELQSHSFISYA